VLGQHILQLRQSCYRQDCLIGDVVSPRNIQESSQAAHVESFQPSDIGD